MRWWFWISCFFALIIIASLIALPFGAVRYIEKHDRALTGREITVEDIDFNLITGNVGIEGLTIYEQNHQDTFFQAGLLEVHLALSKLLQDKIHLRKVLLQAPFVHIQQRGNAFNFDDLLTLVKKRDTTTVPPSTPYTWAVDEVQLREGRFVYEDQIVGSLLELDSLMILSNSLSDGNPLIPATISFRSGEGKWDTRLNLDLKKKTYAVNTQIDNWPLQPFTPYLTRGIQLSGFDSEAAADFSLAGSYQNTDSLAIKGTFDLRDFRMINRENDSLVAWNSLSITIDTANSFAQRYDFGNIKMKNPYLYFEMTEDGDNFTRAMNLTQADSMAQETMQNEQEFNSPFEYLALYLYDLTQAYLSDNYIADTVSVTGGRLLYADHTTHDPFDMHISDLSALSTAITQADKYADFDIHAKVNQKGNLAGDLHVSRLGIRDMMFNVQVDNLYLSEVNPYVDYYMGHSFLDGNLIFISKNTIDDYYLKSENTLLVEQVDVGKNTETNALYAVPMKLAIALLRNPKGNVDIELPIEGQLDDPEYKVGRIILQVLVNVFVKAATSPYKLLANMVGAGEEDMKAITFGPLQEELSNKQQGKLKNIAKVLEEKPELKAAFAPANTTYEKKVIAVAEAKKAFWNTQAASSQDSAWLQQMVVVPGDSLFIRFIQSNLGPEDAVTQDNLPETCESVVGRTKVDSISAGLWKNRRAAIDHFFSENTELSSESWSFMAADSTAADTVAQVYYQVKYRVD